LQSSIGRRAHTAARHSGAVHNLKSQSNQTGSQMAGDRRFRTSDPRQAAEAAFKAATTKPVEPLPKPPPSLPGVKELVSLRIDRDVLDHFQEAGPGWQERINEALRKVVGK
jgi:uncharacterized protein (DUF4415 family)